MPVEAQVAVGNNGLTLPCISTGFHFMLRDYQLTMRQALARGFAAGKRRQVGQMSTGGGKTITFSHIATGYIEKNCNDVLILVHRQELLQQTFRTIYKHYGIICGQITAETKNVKPARIYVGMIETVYKRFQKNPSFVTNIGLLIVDECHIFSFNKIYTFFSNSYILGFTATPLSANKKDPLKNYFDDIVTAIDTPELVEQGSLCPCRTYAAKGAVDTAMLAMKGNDYDEKFMAMEFSKGKHVQNTVDEYRKHADGTKAMVFNCNIQHSLLVTAAFQEAGYDCKHLDGSSENRREIFRWLAETPSAILCNVGVATTGFDDPTVQTIVMNRSTLSLPLWLQITGRGSRPSEGKEYFTILDMGNNAVTHGDWCDARNWYDLFHNPPKPGKKQGVAPTKECPKCFRIVSLNTYVCPEPDCDHEWPRPEIKYDIQKVELELFTRNIDVSQLVQRNDMYGRKQYATFFELGSSIAGQVRQGATGSDLGSPVVEEALSLYYLKAKEWCGLNGKKFNQWHKDTAKQQLYSQLQKYFPSWQMPQ